MNLKYAAKKIKKIAITGPESTGKSTLTKELSDSFSEPFVSEYAREYLYGLDRDYVESDLINIAKGQLEIEKPFHDKSEKLIFLDTELINIKIWSMHKYGKCDDLIIKNIPKQRIDLYLLCNIDIPWEYDPLRENPDQREFFFNWFIKELESYGYKYHVISGTNTERLKSAIEAVKQL